MTQLVILVVAAAWLAVLIPPMLRSRVENRPNSSVTDFRRQLDQLQSTAAPRAGMRAIGSSLAPTGLSRSARAVRAERPVLRSGVTAPQRVDAPTPDDTRPERREPSYSGGGRYRSHGDATGAQRRPEPRRAADPYREPPTARTPEPRRERREHTSPRGVARPVDVARRRRTNVLVLLVGVTAATLFLAATTGSTAMFYAFALSFLALIGYIYLLAQSNQASSYQRPDRRGVGRDDGWFERY